ncbi:hypothetical protein ACJMK2_006116 [Sinanodonta woodiana]|uniref:Uncharacterized protein n=1 Tax=Sinanodonta woodiana TaxID=1069815 RepID=A0ABD3VSE7_SINWO
MPTLIHLTCLLAVLHGWVRCDLFDNPCRIIPNGAHEEQTTIDVNATLGCHNGSLRWDYPRGGVRVHFHYKGLPMFKVCLKDRLGGDVFEIYDVTYNVQHALPVARDSPKEVCTGFHHSEAVILFQAPEMMVYMGEVAYRIQPLYLPGK